MTIRRPYIAGPMTGCPENNYPRFAHLLRALRAIGLDPQSPHLLEANIPGCDKSKMSKGDIYKMVMPGDIYMLSTCDSIITLPGWRTSPGATFEVEAAKLFGLRWEDTGPTEEIAGRIGYTPQFMDWVERLCDRLVNNPKETACEPS